MCQESCSSANQVTKIPVTDFSGFTFCAFASCLSGQSANLERLEVRIFLVFVEGKL